MDYKELFNKLHPDFWNDTDIRSMPEDLSFSEMILDLQDYQENEDKEPVQPCDIRYFRGGWDRLRDIVGRVDEKWPEFFNEGDRVLCAYLDGGPVSFCIIEDMGTISVDITQKQLSRLGGPGCVGTLPEYRCRGIGRAVVRKATAILKEEGFDYSYIHYTGVPEWYAAMGYRKILTWNKYGFTDKEK